MALQTATADPWSLPLAAWQAIAHYLEQEDALTARLVCSSWRQDLGTCIPTAKALPSLLLHHNHQQQHQPDSPQAPQPAAAAAALSQPDSTAADEGRCANDTVLEAAAAGSHAACTSSLDQRLHVSGGISSAMCAGQASSSLAAAQAGLQQPQQLRQHSAPDAHMLSQLLEAFPHCRTLHVDVSCPQQQQLAAQLLNRLAATGRQQQPQVACHAGMGDTGPEKQGGLLQQPKAANETTQHQQQQPDLAAGALQQQQQRGPLVCLDAVSRSFHCRARQDCPYPPAGAAALLFNLLEVLPRQLRPQALHSLHSLDLDVFPDSPSDWLVLQGLTGLRELLLPPFKPALPHEHLPAVAQLTQLTALTASVQGSVTSWHACKESFSALRSLTRLRHLSMHAFHCPGKSLTAGVSHLGHLTELRLSGRVVLQPVSCLLELTGLRVLEVTQDMQYSLLCDLHQSLPHLTQLAVGRISLPVPHATHQPGPPAAIAAAAAAMAAADIDQWPPPGAAAPAAAEAAGDAAAAAAEAGADVVAAGVGAGADGADGVEHDDVGSDAGAAAGDDVEGAGPAAAQPQLAAAAMLPPPPLPPLMAAAAEAPELGNNNNNGGAAAAANVAGVGGGGGEVLLEDVGLIVDGLVGNLQEGTIPAHLQRIVERFESIIQLDLTRRASSSPWAWPTGGLALLAEAQGLSDWVKQGPPPPPAAAAAAAGVVHAAASVRGEAVASSSSSTRVCRSSAADSAHNRGAGHGSSSSGGSRFGSSGGCGNSSSSSSRVQRQAPQPLQSFELALLRPSDVAQLMELPAELRATRHLGLRLRDQLLAFANVSALKLEPGQLAPLGYTFEHLASLSLSGKISLDGQILRELTAAFAGSNGSNGSSGGSSGRRLESLCMDVHFVGVGPEDVAAALQVLPRLKVLSLRHRGAGKLLLPVNCLPRSLTVLALKKVMLYYYDCSASSSSSSSSGGGSGSSSAGLQAHSSTQEQQRERAALAMQLEAEGSEMSHAITSPGFNRAALTGTISAAGLPALADAQQPSPSTAWHSMGGALADNAQPGTPAGPSSSAASAASNAAGRSRAEATTVTGHGVGPGCCDRPHMLLPHLEKLYLKLCLVPSGALAALLGLNLSTPSVRQHQQQQHMWQRQRQGWSGEGPSSSSTGSSGSSGSSSGGNCGLKVLSLTGDSLSRADGCEAWGHWLAALRQMKALQVLELSLPELSREDSHQDHCLPQELLPVLQSLPRLAHLALTTSHNAATLMGLTKLTGLRTLSLHYSGPPALPPGLLGQLQEALGPFCRVQLWEQLVLQQQGFFAAERQQQEQEQQAASAADGAAAAGSGGQGGAAAAAVNAGASGSADVAPEQLAVNEVQGSGPVQLGGVEGGNGDAAVQPAASAGELAGELSEQGALAAALPLAADVLLTGAAAGSATGSAASASGRAAAAAAAAPSGAAGVWGQHVGAADPERRLNRLLWVLRRARGFLGVVGGGVLVVKALKRLH